MQKRVWGRRAAADRLARVKVRVTLHSAFQRLSRSVHFLLSIRPLIFTFLSGEERLGRMS